MYSQWNVPYINDDMYGQPWNGIFSERKKEEGSSLASNSCLNSNVLIDICMHIHVYVGIHAIDKFYI